MSSSRGGYQPRKQEPSSYSNSKQHSTVSNHGRKESATVSATLNRPPIPGSSTSYRSSTISNISKPMSSESTSISFTTSPVIRPPVPGLVRSVLSRGQATTPTATTASSSSSTTTTVPITTFKPPPPSSSFSMMERSMPKQNDFGVIVSIKDKFGFIQPLQGKEQIYFSEREFYSGINIGDEVSYIKRPSIKGYLAERLSLVHAHSKEVIKDLTAIVLQEADIVAFRGTPGLLEISDESKRMHILSNPHLSKIIQIFGPLPPIPFFQESILPSNSTKTIRKLSKGDEVIFSLSFVPGSPYLKGVDVLFVRGRRDRLLSEQIQKMLEAGVKREQGVIDTIKNGEYGFIRPVERSEQIYFRVDDVVEENKVLEQGMEVEFFVIAESVKGKLSDRAVHLSQLPNGTVQFEITIAEGVIGYVMEESSTHSSHEKPGIIKLIQSIPKATGTDQLNYVELWQRCLPDDLLLTVGDTISFDIQHYRPENLYFARSVNIKSYQKLSREYGSICSIKESGFGFIRSHIRDMDLYFRTAEVRDEVTGKLIPENNLTIDQVVSFNVIIDESSSFKGINASSSKLKALRVQLISSNSTIINSTTTTNNVEGIPRHIDDLRLSLVEKNICGTVTKDAINKRDSPPGTIQILPEHMYRIHDLKFFHPPELIYSVQDFVSNPVISEITIKYLTSGQRKAYFDLLDDLFSDVLIHESIELPKDSYLASDPSKGRTVKISKLSKSTDATTTTTTVTSATATAATTMTSNGIVSSKEENGRDKLKKSSTSSSTKVLMHNCLSDDGIVLYHKQDVDEIYGPLAKDLEVCFDIYVDKRTMKKIARNIKLTDDPIVEDNQLNYGYSYDYGYDGYSINNGSRNGNVGDNKISLCYGVIDSIVGVKSGRFGFIRRLPMDEKLFWHSSAIIGTDPNSNTIDYDTLHENQEVSFQLRRRGGMRCAVDVRVVPYQSLYREVDLEGFCTALVVDTNRVVIVDASNCPMMSCKLWDIRRLAIDFDSQSILSMITMKSDIVIDDKANNKIISGVVDGKAESSSESETVDKVGIKYYPAISREVIPLLSPFEKASSSAATVTPAVESITTEQYNINSLIQCQIRCNWAMKRQPTGAIIHPSSSLLSLSSSSDLPSILSKVQGNITKLKIKGETVLHELLTIYSKPTDQTLKLSVSDPWYSLEFCEIQYTGTKPKPLLSGLNHDSVSNAIVATAVETSESSQHMKISTYYCLFSELGYKSDGTSTSRDSVQIGDKVEFFPSSTHHLALYPIVLPKIQYRRPGIEIKSPSINSGKIQSVSGIIMAKGPPQDAAVGFEIGWREAPDTSTLPWSHMFQ